MWDTIANTLTAGGFGSEAMRNTSVALRSAALDLQLLRPILVAAVTTLNSTNASVSNGVEAVISVLDVVVGLMQGAVGLDAKEDLAVLTDTLDAASLHTNISALPCYWQPYSNMPTSWLTARDAIFDYAATGGECYESTDPHQDFDMFVARNISRVWAMASDGLNRAAGDDQQRSELLESATLLLSDVPMPPRFEDALAVCKYSQKFGEFSCLLCVCCVCVCVCV